MRKEQREQFDALAGRLRQARLNQKRSLRSVAQEMGVGSSMLMYWERCAVMPSGAYFIAWVQALGFYLDITDAGAGEP